MAYMDNGTTGTATFQTIIVGGTTYVLNSQEATAIGSTVGKSATAGVALSAFGSGDGFGAGWFYKEGTIATTGVGWKAVSLDGRFTIERVGSFPDSFESGQVVSIGFTVA